MSIDNVHIFLLIASLTSLIALFFLRPIRSEHILFALLSISLLLLAISALLPDSLSMEQQFIALGTFATCNVFWLLTRTLFRKGKALTTHHYVLAGIIALLILFSRTIDIFVAQEWLQQDTVVWLKRMLSETLRLLSSAVLLLAFWEIIRNHSTSPKHLKKQKMLLASSMLISVLSTRVIVPSIPVSPELNELIYLWVRGIAACLILASTYAVLWLQYRQRVKQGQNDRKSDPAAGEDELLIQDLAKLMDQDKPYLNSDLKLIDVANHLNVSEYRISRALRERSNFDNFNQYINSYRIEHAKHLMQSDIGKHWTILVISMESGFASLAPFNRAFKAQQGCTPNQFRKNLPAENE